MNTAKKLLIIIPLAIATVYVLGLSFRVFAIASDRSHLRQVNINSTNDYVINTGDTSDNTTAANDTPGNSSSTNSKRTAATTKQTTKTAESTSTVYSGSNPDWTNVRYDWTSSKGTHNLYISLNLDRNAYNYYCSYKNRPSTPSQLSVCVQEAYNKQLVEELVKCFRQIQSDCGYSDGELAYEVIYFVQNCITYQKDIDGTGEREHYKFPIETIFSKRGDCEDVSILMSALLSELGYGNVFLTYTDHVMVGIKGSSLSGTYYNYNGTKYYTLECTSVCQVGFAGDYANKSAKIYYPY